MPATVSSNAGSRNSKAPLALVGATIYTSPEAPPTREGVLLIRQGKIASVSDKGLVQIPATADVMDCTGMTVLAGFWNSHVHFFERMWADADKIPADELSRQLAENFARYGFTSVFDTGSGWENTQHIRARVEAGDVRGPRIRSTGPAMLPPGAMPPDIVLTMMGSLKFAAPEIGDAGTAASTTGMLLNAGVDAIKLFASSPRSGPLKQEILAAAVDEAHAAGKLAFVHPNTGADVLTSLRAGVDIIAHTTPHTGPWEQAIIDLALERRASLTPTLALWKYFARHDRISKQDDIVSAEIAQLRNWVEAGGTVLFGTDFGAVGPDPSDEYALMAAAGMNFPQILESLTTAPAARFGDAKVLGQVAPGFLADLVVVDGDPARDLRALTAVRYTMRDGAITWSA